MARVLAPELGGGSPMAGRSKQKWPLNLGSSVPVTAPVS